ncbi:teichuronic acid biosynthesis protein TuaE [Niallia sp. MER 6]|uniref:teichuronic acid biosynthesis protein TuaE n=1 Tax=Niallia sp. MER 6 TaxID=2939567 RepID=UPI002042371B|nr:O-antigen ligase family protein [Niallia sp. MER 6]MCM3031982.1 O-antigen ligase family protein [Niallia sp. MER 6]
MESKQLVRQTIGALIVVMALLSLLYAIQNFDMKLLLLLLGGFGGLLLFLYLKSTIGLEDMLRGAVYALLITTFLNQSIININIGFFSLFLYRILLIAAVFIYFMYAISDKGLKKDFDGLSVKGIWMFLAIWLVYGTVSMLWARSIIETFKYMSLMWMGLLFVYLANVTFTRVSRLIIFYVIWMGMTLLLMAIGLVNHYLHIQLPTSSLYGAGEYRIGYPTAVFFNQNDFAAFLSISFFFYLAAAKNGSSIKVRIPALVLSVLSFYVIYLTQSRAGILSVLIGLCFYVFLLVNDKLKKLLLIGAFSAAGIAVLLFSGRLIGKFQHAFTQANLYGVDETMPSNLARINLLRNIQQYIIDTFGIGVGAGNIPYYLKNHPVFSTGGVQQAHNWLAEIAGNFGIFILLGYVGLILSLFIQLYRIYKKANSRTYKMLLEASMLGLAAFMASSISPSTVSNLYFHWVLMGFIISVLSVFKKRIKAMDKGIVSHER